MQLKLLVKNRRGEYHCFYKEELTLPDYKELPFKENVELRKMYVEGMIKSVGKKYERFLEGKQWRVEITIESKLSQVIEPKLKIA